VLKRLLVYFNPKYPNSIGPPLITDVVNDRGDVRVYEQSTFLPVEFRDRELLRGQHTRSSIASHDFASSWVGP